ncbi:DUF4910 domain-containing protein [Bacillus tianshenii]|nr:DUF4910 domain-containing protein [Bacillus tianshenii]
MVSKKNFSAALAASVAVGAVVVPSLHTEAAPNAQSDHAFDNKVVKKVQVDNIYNHIDKLSEQPRVAGSEAEYEAVQYIKKQFESYGLEVEVQPFPFTSYTEPDTVSFSVEGSEMEFDVNTFSYGVNGQVSGELAYAGLGTKEDLEGKDLTGKIALIQRGELSFADKVLNAAEKGAEGVIIFNHSEGNINGTFGEPNEDYVPAVALSKADGEALLEKVEAGESVSASINIEGAETSEKTSYNVVATKEATHHDTNDIIILGAHHDSVAGAPGANDDASGTAMTLEMARVLSNMPTDTELRFVTFGAEENGLIGSTEYVKTLSEDEISRTKAMFQLDMVGSRDAGELIMYTADGERNIVTDTAASAGARWSPEQDPVAYGQGGRSDHMPFAEAGIPAALFIHAPVEPWYHSPDDTLDKISKEKLEEVAQIVGSSIYQLARKDTPALENAQVAPTDVEYPFETRELD